MDEKKEQEEKDSELLDDILDEILQKNMDVAANGEREEGFPSHTPEIVPERMAEGGLQADSGLSEIVMPDMNATAKEEGGQNAGREAAADGISGRQGEAVPGEIDPVKAPEDYLERVFSDDNKSEEDDIRVIEMEVGSEDDTKITKKDILSMLLYVAVIFLLTFFIVHYVGQRTRVSGSSMEDTLSNGDNLIVDKLTYRFSDPKRFDVIIFPFQYDTDVYYIKRIIGLPGETVQIDEEGTIYIDGEVLEEDYGLETIHDPGIAIDPIHLGEDEYFVLGDNRNNSSDSRFSGVANVKRDTIIGRAWIRIYPFNKFKKL